VSRDPYIVFPGNLQGRHARELGEKGATLVTYEGDRVTSVEARALDVVRWDELSLSTAQAFNVEDVLSEAQEALRGAVTAAQGRLLAFRVRIAGPSRLDAELRAARARLTEELCNLSYSAGGAGAWLEKLVIQTRPLTSEAPAGDDALAEIERVLSELGGPEASELLKEVLADLSRKLPDEVLELVPELRGQHGDATAELAKDVQSMLRERLSSTRAEPA
jgi:hypothetical protein